MARVVKMGASEREAFTMSEFSRAHSVVTVQQSHRGKFGCDPPSDDGIRRWYNRNWTMGCLCERKSTGLPAISDEKVERVRERTVYGS